MAEKFLASQPSSSDIAKRIEGFPSWIEVDLDAVTHNLEEVRKRVGVEVIPCVKTNAYGHGIARAYGGLQSADGFALLDLAEAEQVRALSVVHRKLYGETATA